MSLIDGNAVGGSLDLDVVTDAADWQEALPDCERLCRGAAAVAFAFATERAPAWAGSTRSACVLLADDARVRTLNRTYRGRDEATNVLAFPSVEPDVLAAIGAEGPPEALGDIVVAFETAAGEAARDSVPLAHHLSHLVVHGMLHLLGYDHQAEDDAVVMEALETRILAELGVPDPYAATDER